MEELELSSLWMYGTKECIREVKSGKTCIYTILLPWWIVHGMHVAYIVDLHEI